jgi:hypothetical protein
MVRMVDSKMKDRSSLHLMLCFLRLMILQKQVKCFSHIIRRIVSCWHSGARGRIWTANRLILIKR